MNVVTTQARIGDSRIAERLRRETEGEVLFGRRRSRPLCDGCQHLPDRAGRRAGAAQHRRCRSGDGALPEEGIPVLPRGGGTSQCGQTVNRALVIDCTKYLRDVARRSIPRRAPRVVEPGIALGALNDPLQQHGLFFPVDPSTMARCTIGGMAGNNSCGSKSIRYGLMADNVLAIDALLADGARFRFGPSCRTTSAPMCRPASPT